MIALLAISGAPAGAHPVAAPSPASLWRDWQPEWWSAVLLLVLAGAYASGVRRLWHHAGRRATFHVIPLTAFALAWCTLCFAMLSPLHALGSALFAAHMLQHELLVVVAAPLLVVARVDVGLLWAASPRIRRCLARRPVFSSLWSWCASIPGSTLLHGVILWIWHATPLYEASLHHEVVHALQHATFLASALLFWQAMLGPMRTAKVTADRMRSVAALFLTTLHTVVLGALITMSSRPWFAAYRDSTFVWGLSPLEDQQLAGLVMWVPGGIAYFAVALHRLAPVLYGDDTRMVSQTKL